MIRRGTLAVAAILAAALVGSAAAQTRPGGPAAPAAPAGPAGFDPASIRETIMAAIKTKLACTDDEWKLIEPKLIKVALLKMDVGELAAIGRMGRGGRMTSFIRTILDPNALPSPVAQCEAELQTLIDQKENSTDAYKNKLAQLRKARAKAREQLAVAEKEVTSLLTIRQEAELVEMGVID